MIAYGHRIDIGRERRQRFCLEAYLDPKTNQWHNRRVPFRRGPARMRYVATFPRRWVNRSRHSHGMKCSSCSRRCCWWICSDATWNRLPSRWRNTKLCTRCFRTFVSERQAYAYITIGRIRVELCHACLAKMVDTVSRLKRRRGELLATKGRRGLASMSFAKRSRISSLGGKAGHAAGTAHEFTPGEAREAGQKGAAWRRAVGSPRSVGSWRRKKS